MLVILVYIKYPQLKKRKYHFQFQSFLPFFFHSSSFFNSSFSYFFSSSPFICLSFVQVHNMFCVTYRRQNVCCSFLNTLIPRSVSEIHLDNVTRLICIFLTLICKKIYQHNYNQYIYFFISSICNISNNISSLSLKVCGIKENCRSK